jgi:hypothetical protein
MAKTSTPAFTQNILNSGTTFVTTDQSTYKVIAMAGANDSRVVHISIATDDNLGNTAFFAIRKSGVDYPLSWVAIPSFSGYDGTADIVEALIATTFLHRQIDNNANPYFELQAGLELVMRLQNPVSVAKTLWVLVTQEDY